ncbi:hypothetical protein NDU88_008964 [Pleurodeles waltl]|uniref:Uncharacterized protein n=1 Tax=Pleurodeles waltl TaxID=8319 RepID=A0AAV7RW73_PLEWA|nr:hypothetical protein NDU88_008964 [Pleurodeles waltl]
MEVAVFACLLLRLEGKNCSQEGVAVIGAQLKKEELSRWRSQERPPTLAPGKPVQKNHKTMVTVAVQTMEPGGGSEARLLNVVDITDAGVSTDEGTWQEEGTVTVKGDKDQRTVDQTATTSGTEGVQMFEDKTEKKNGLESKEVKVRTLLADRMAMNPKCYLTSLYGDGWKIPLPLPAEIVVQIQQRVTAIIGWGQGHARDTTLGSRDIEGAANDRGLQKVGPLGECLEGWEKTMSGVVGNTLSLTLTLVMLDIWEEQSVTDIHSSSAVLH